MGFALLSCSRISGLVHEGDVVARVGKEKLYSVELENFIPAGVSPEDSAKLAARYIDKWAIDRLYQETAERELGKADLDVSKELEDYRRSLLKYKYEQLYINQRLDTAITGSQIDEYYDSHQDQLKLSVPIVKARFVTVLKDSRNYSRIKTELAVDDESGMVSADSLLFMSTLRNTDFGGRWIEASVLAREFGIDYVTMLSSVRNGYVEKLDAEGNHNLAYIFATVPAGQTGPEEFYLDRIREIILNARKQKLLSSLEQDLVTEAREKGELTVY